MIGTADRAGRQTGFSLLELSLALVLTTVVLYALHSSLHASMSGRQAGDRLQTIHEMARDQLERLRTLPFGRASDTKATGAQLSELFDDDDDYGGVTLHQVAVPYDQPGHSFTVRTRGIEGTIRVKVSNDIDGDGKVDGFRENRSDLLSVRVFFEERLVFWACIAADPAMTAIDSTIDYLSGI